MGHAVPDAFAAAASEALKSVALAQADAAFMGAVISGSSLLIYFLMKRIVAQIY